MAGTLSTARLDALREVANIGAGHAATALSTLTATRIMISVPMVNIVPPGDFVPEIAPDVEVVAVHMEMSGDISGRTIFLLAVPAALRLAERMLRRVVTDWESEPRHSDPVFHRDGWRCAVPACSGRRNLHDHHIRFRSQGGGNERENRVTVCAAHHLHGIHAGHVRAHVRSEERRVGKECHVVCRSRWSPDH